MPNTMSRDSFIHPRQTNSQFPCFSKTSQVPFQKQLIVSAGHAFECNGILKLVALQRLPSQTKCNSLISQAYLAPKMDTGYLTTQVTTIIGQLHSVFDDIGVPTHERESRETEVRQPSWKIKSVLHLHNAAFCRAFGNTEQSAETRDHVCRFCIGRWSSSLPKFTARKMSLRRNVIGSSKPSSRWKLRLKTRSLMTYTKSRTKASKSRYL